MLWLMPSVAPPLDVLLCIHLSMLWCRVGYDPLVELLVFPHLHFVVSYGPPSACPPPSGGGEAVTRKDKFVLGYQEDAWFLQPENAASLVPHGGFLLH